MYNNRYSNKYGNSPSSNQNQSIRNNESTSEAFSISPVKAKIINEIKEQSKNKTMEEMLPEIMKISNELNKRNMGFTREETTLLLESIEASMSPAEKQKFEMIKSFL